MDKLDLVEAVNRSGLIEVFTHPFFRPVDIEGCDPDDRYCLYAIRDYANAALQNWNTFQATAYEYHAEADCD